VVAAMEFGKQNLSLRLRGRAQKMDDGQGDAPGSQILAAFLCVIVQAPATLMTSSMAW